MGLQARYHAIDIYEVIVIPVLEYWATRTEHNKKLLNGV